MSGNESKYYHCHKEIESHQLFNQDALQKQHDDNEEGSAIVIFAIFASLNIALLVIIVFSLIFK